MPKKKTSDIEIRWLDESLYSLHKEGQESGDFGMNNTSELVDVGFGLYSTANTREIIDAVKAQYYRITLVRSGSCNYSIGSDTFSSERNTMLFGAPGQVFSFNQLTEDFFAYYMLISKGFMTETLFLEKSKGQFSFFIPGGKSYLNVHEDIGIEIEYIILKINDEIKKQNDNAIQFIRSYLNLILITAGRSYTVQHGNHLNPASASELLYKHFLKLISEHFQSNYKVSEYAGMLHISADHLNKLIKIYSGHTAHELINETLLTEAKINILHSSLSISEIAYKLGFNDPSHFSKFFRRLTGSTPSWFRHASE